MANTIKIGSIEADAIKIGTSTVSKVYVGTELVYPNGGGRLPQGYTEVEYIQNTTNAYINTGLQIYSSMTDSFEVKMRVIPIKHNSETLQNVFSCMSESGEPYQGFTYRFSNNTVKGESIPTEQNTFSIVNNQDSTQTVTVTSSSSQRTYTHTYPLTIFCGLDASRNPFRFTDSKVYECDVKFNNTLIMSLIPCTRDSDDTAGFYDLVNDTFHSSASSYPLVAGNPV